RQKAFRPSPAQPEPVESKPPTLNLEYWTLNGDSAEAEQDENTKNQAPNTRKVSNHKLQCGDVAGRIGIWSLEFLWCLVFESRDLVFLSPPCGFLRWFPGPGKTSPAFHATAGRILDGSTTQAMLRALIQCANGFLLIIILIGIPAITSARLGSLQLSSAPKTQMLTLWGL